MGVVTAIENLYLRSIKPSLLVHSSDEAQLFQEILVEEL
jgi:hypothetical protein